MRASLIACALAALAAFGAPVTAMPQGTLAPLAKLQAQIGEAVLLESETAPVKTLVPGTKEWENSPQCFVGDVNICTRESKAWNPRSQMAHLGDLIKKVPKIIRDSMTPKTLESGYEGFALLEGEQEGESALASEVDAEADAEAEAEADEEADVEVDADAESEETDAAADEEEPSAFMEAAVQGKCSGRCQAMNLPCATSYQSGMCPGAANIKCCVARSTSKTTTKKTTTNKTTTTKKTQTKTTTKAPVNKTTKQTTKAPAKTSTTKAPTKTNTTKAPVKTTNKTTKAPVKTQGSCSGRCQAANLPCATSYQSGMCPGAANMKCCVAPSTSKTTNKTTTNKTTPVKTTTKKTTTTTTKKTTTKKTTKTSEPEVTGPLTLTGVSKRIRDPRQDLMKKGHRMHWGDFTSIQQANARLLVRAAKAESPSASVNQIAYIIGTANWECLLQPISEWGGRNTRYAPYYGRGFVQLTWEDNYRKMTSLLLEKRGITANLVDQPNLALDPTNAAFIAAYGMFHGTFTGKKLSHYFTSKKSDWNNARRIINGMDKAAAIAQLSRQWVPLVELLVQE